MKINWSFPALIFILINGCFSDSNKLIFSQCNCGSDTAIIIDVPGCVGCFERLPEIIIELKLKNDCILLNTTNAKFEIIYNQLAEYKCVNRLVGFYEFDKGEITILIKNQASPILKYSVSDLLIKNN